MATGPRTPQVKHPSPCLYCVSGNRFRRRVPAQLPSNQRRTLVGEEAHAVLIRITASNPSRSHHPRPTEFTVCCCTSPNRGCSMPYRYRALHGRRTHPCMSTPERLQCWALCAIIENSDVNENLVEEKEEEEGAELHEGESAEDDGGGGPTLGIGVYASKALAVGELLPPEWLIVIMSCAVGLMTGVGVVLFNLGVHELHDIVWQGIPSSGGSWLRTQPLEKHWVQVLSVPAGGGVIVGILNFLRSSWGELDAHPSQKLSRIDQAKIKLATDVKAFLGPVIKTVAALVTLATGNSLGPEGPSVEVGASIANGLGTALKNSRERKLSLIAAGSAAGISSGFNAAISGCFFAVESVLRPLSADSAPSLTTAMVLLSSVLASVVSQAGLGSDPAFKIPAYDFRSPAELPLYLVLGILCGLVSVVLTKCSSFSTSVFRNLKVVTGVPDVFLPPFGGLCVGFIALAYPEVLYWGFENVDILLESRPLQRGPPAMLLLQLVGAKIVSTSICRGSGLVGGFYAPSLFIGAALGSAYGKLAGFVVTHADPMFHLDALKVAVPQAYALVGMAATLAGVCQVPLTSVLLLFELTRDYRIIIPLMAAVGVSSWVASAASRKQQRIKLIDMKDGATQFEMSSDSAGTIERKSETHVRMKSSLSDTDESPEVAQSMRLPKSSSRVDNDLCAVDNSLCMADKDLDEEKLVTEITVAVAMRTCFAAVAPSVTVHEALEVMLARKEWCALLVQDGNILEGIVTFSDIQQHAERMSQDGQLKVGALTVSAICNSWVNEDAGFPVITAYPDMSLRVAWRLMTGRGLRQLPVVSRDLYLKDKVKVVQGILDRECIQLACRAEATRRLLGMPSLSFTCKGSGKYGQ